MKPIFRFFAERHLMAYLATIMIILLGLGTLVGIKRGVFPQVDFGVMNILTRYPGASPEDVELNVTNRIEAQLKNVTGIDRITSISMENISLIEVYTDIDARDQDEIKARIRDAVDRVADLPPEVTAAPLVTEMNTAEMDVIEVGLTGNLPYREMREAARLFEKKLKAIPGVSRLDRFGYRAREIKVEVLPDAIARYQLPLEEIIAAIHGRNIREKAASFESFTREQDLVTLAQLRDPLEVGDVIIRSTFDGPVIRVRDLAVVRDDFEDEKVLSRMNGQAAISFLVYITKEADAIRTCDAIKDLVDGETRKLPEGVHLLYVNDESRYIRNSFNVLLSNGAIGLVLVLLLLSIFLAPHTAFWVAMGIPVALLGTIFLLPWFGMYLDTVSLAGMILVLGIIVDDAIIISENITRRREKGDEPLAAAVEGIHEVFRPVLTTILTTILVFAPAFFMPGMLGKTVMVVPLAISLALIISLVEAVVALPAHLLPRLHRRQVKPGSPSRFDIISTGYRHLLSRLLHYRYIVIPAFLLLLAASLWFASAFMKFIIFPTETSEHLFITNELPTGTPLRVTSDKMSALEEVVASLPEEELASFTTRIGTNPWINAESENYAYISVNLTPFTQRSRGTDEIVASLRQATDELPDQGDILYSIIGTSPPVGKPVSIRVVGSDDDLRFRMADSVEAFLTQIAGVKDITRDDKRGKDQVQIRIKYDNLSRLGLTVADIARSVRTAYDGEVVTRVRYGDEDVGFRVIMEEKARKQLTGLHDLLIPNRQGRLIPLREVAWLHSSPGLSDYRHFDGERAITVEADLDQDVIAPLEVTRTVFSHFDLEQDWPGMQLRLSGELFETEQSVAGLAQTFLLAIIAVYFLLVLLFNSLTQPFLVMIAIPFGIIGVIIAFAIHGEPLSFMGVLGVIGLCGIVVNDSIVLVSHINDLRSWRKDQNLLSLVSEGTADRLRAIILTTLTTVAAFLPLAYGLGGAAPFVAPMALALGWGLVFATPLTLTVIPCLYLAGQDIIGIVKRRKTAGES